MKRKIVQHGPSTLIVSLPSKWARENFIKKGDEIEMEVREKEVVIRNDKDLQFETKEIDMKQYAPIIERVIHALYKKGVDEIKILVESPKQISLIQSAISKETVGYEIVEQSKNSCIIRSVASDIGEFDSLLKRVFLLQLTMCRDGLEALKKGEYERLNQINIMEETNNRLTTMCRRALNKRGNLEQCKGPLYYIVEDMENLADEYKNLFTQILNHKGQIKINKDILNIYERVNEIIELFYRLFYKFDEKKMIEIIEKREGIVKDIYAMIDKKNNKIESIMLGSQLIVTQKIFCFLGPYLVLQL